MASGTLKPKAVWEKVDKLDRSQHGLLVIQDIDDEWCDALCKWYLKAINRRFILQHILGLDARAIQEPANARRQMHDHDEELARSLLADLERLDRMFPYLWDREHERFGGHIDCRLASERPGYRGYPFCGCHLSLGKSDRVKINRLLL